MSDTKESPPRVSELTNGDIASTAIRYSETHNGDDDATEAARVAFEAGARWAFTKSNREKSKSEESEG